MTIDERLNRIEHFTAGMAEERKRDREESRALWRQTQEQLHKLTMLLAEHADESRAADDRLAARVDELAAKAEAADAKLGARIEALVSAIGQMAADYDRRMKAVI